YALSRMRIRCLDAVAISTHFLLWRRATYSRRMASLPGERGLTVTLFGDFGDGARAHRAATFTNRKPRPFLQRHRSMQLHLHRDVVAWNHHLDAFGQPNRPRHIGGADVKLGPIAVEEGGVASALFLREHIDLRLELLMRLD